MNRDLSKNSDNQIREQIQGWVDAMFTDTEEGASINSVTKHSPLIQWAQNELTSRFIKKTTILAIGTSVLALVVSLGALVVSLDVFDERSIVVAATRQDDQAAPVLSDEQLLSKCDTLVDFLPAQNMRTSLGGNA